jgi:hypothetical protein
MTSLFQGESILRSDGQYFLPRTSVIERILCVPAQQITKSFSTEANLIKHAVHKNFY